MQRPARCLWSRCRPRRARRAITPPQASVAGVGASSDGMRRRSRRQSFDPRWWRQLEDPVLEELENAALAANRDIQSALARLRSGTGGLRRGPPAALSDGDGERVRRRPRAGPAWLQRRAAAHHHVSRRPRRVVGAGLVRPRAFGDRRGVGERQSFEAALDSVRVSVAAEVARNYFELRGIQQQLVGPRPQPRQPARDAAVDGGSARRRVRRGTGRGERVGASRGDRGRGAAAAHGARRPRAPARSADRPRAWPAGRDGRAARLSGARQVDRARAAGPALRHAGRTCASRNGVSRLRRPQKASPPRISIHASPSPACSACWPDAAACSAHPTRGSGR